MSLMSAVEKDVVSLRVAGGEVRAAVEHLLYVFGNGWMPAGEVREGDVLRTPEGRGTTVVSLGPVRRERIWCCVECAGGDRLAPPEFGSLTTGPWPAGTLVETPDGLRAIEDLKPGDSVVMPDPRNPERN